MYAGNFCSLRKPAITGDVPPLIGNQLYSQSRKKYNFIFTTTPTTKCILSKKHTFSLFTASVVFFSTKCLSSNDYPVRQGNKYSLCLIEIFNLIIIEIIVRNTQFQQRKYFLSVCWWKCFRISTRPWSRNTCFESDHKVDQTQNKHLIFVLQIFTD